MGRKDKSYSKNLHQQAYERLTGMQAFGESKREAKENGTDAEKIFSASTRSILSSISKKITRSVPR